LTKIEQMTKEKLLKRDRTMINASIGTRNNLKQAAAKLKVPMYALLQALSHYALHNVDSVLDLYEPTQTEKTQEQ